MISANDSQYKYEVRLTKTWIRNYASESKYPFNKKEQRLLECQRNETEVQFVGQHARIDRNLNTTSCVLEIKTR